MNVIEDITAIKLSNDLTVAVKRLTTAIEKFGLQQFVYLRLGGDSLLPEESIHTYSAAWAQRYVERGYDKIDPVISLAWSNAKAFTWSADDFSNDEQVSEFFKEANAFGLYKGFTIPLKTMENKKAFLTFAAPKEAKRFDEVCKNSGNLSLMASLGSAFHQRALYFAGNRGIGLTKREKEVASYSGAGLTARDISEILGISQDTVNENLAKAMRKTGADNKSALSYILAVEDVRKSD